mgnify:FL=1
MNGLKRKYAIFGLAVLLLIQISLLGVLFTKARFEEEAKSGSWIYDGNMEYIVAEQVEVRSVEELIASIENGYSNIKIADSVDNPLIITSGVTDVGADLILDLNGHEIQRNNREPMLNIENGVRLTIIDTSVRQDGSFYNPVGSVLQIGGGTLTVAAGDFISGPKKSEYAHFNGTEWTAKSSVTSSDGLFTLGGEGGSIGTTEATVSLYIKSENSYKETTAAMPVIDPYITDVQYAVGEENQQHWFVNGNMYFRENPNFGAAYGGQILGDTYLYHVIDDSSVAGTTIAASGSADFYYTYRVLRTTDTDGKPSYIYTESSTGENVFTVTVYGYKNVKGTANKGTKYATVKMLAGNMYARGGSYTTNFGTGDSYGIYVSGGYMAVEAGVFDAIEGGVCIECAYTEISDEEYLRVAGGSFYSDNGDTIRVSGGRMEVSGGEFFKDSTVTASQGENNSAIIRVTIGKLTAAGPDAQKLAFSLTGAYQYGVYAQGGTVSIENAAFTFAENDTGNNVGVYADGAATTLADTDIYIEGVNGSGNFGVNAAANITLNGTCNIEVAGRSSGGLLAQGGNITYSGGDEDDTLTVALAMRSDDFVLDSLAIAALNGSITLAGNVKVDTDGLGVVVWNTQDSHAAGNKISLTKGTLTIGSAENRTRATALYVSGGDVEFSQNTTVEITSEADENCYVPSENKNMYMFDGVYVQGGSLKANGIFNVTHAGVDNDYQYEYNDSVTNSDGGNGADLYLEFEIKSFAVRVESSANTSSEVTIIAGEIMNTIGGGLYVGGGNVILGDEKGNGPTIQTSGTETYDSYTAKVFEEGWLGGGSWNESRLEYIPFTGADETWNYKISKTGGHAVQVAGDTETKLTVNSGSYSAVMGNGILVSSGEVYIKGGEFSGADSYPNSINSDPNSTNNNTAMAGAAASYGFKMYGGKITVEGGTFKSTGGGAFIMGMADAPATADILNATFEAGGTAGLSVYRYATVNMGQQHRNDMDNITMSGKSNAISIENTGNTSGTAVNIYYGDYTGAQDGIWYGEKSSGLTIMGGTFTADIANSDDARSGLFFDVKPDEGKVKISDGTFVGNSSEKRGGFAWQTPYYTNGAIGADCTLSEWNIWSGVGADILVTDIIASGCYAHCEEGFVTGDYDSNNRNRLGESLAGANKIIVNDSVI